MPVSKCNGKWRIGSGPCRYSSKKAAEDAWAGARAAGAKSTVVDDLIQATEGLGRKFTQSEAGFIEKGGVNALQCGECGNFKPGGGACAIVKGKIDASDVCNFFDPAVFVGSMDSVFAKSKTIDMFISKASEDPESGEKRWAAVASDTDLDAFNDRMSLELFSDFIERIDADEEVPSQFASEVWKGGMPYLGLAHYMDLDGAGIVGDPSSVYVDGNRLKSKGVFRDTPLGAAAFEAVKLDQKNGIDPDERIRISIAFIDWAHDHGEEPFVRESLETDCDMCSEGKGDKIYKSGQLVHLALTRVPVNERTPIWLEERAMPKTMKEDALAVLGDDGEDIVDELDELSKKKKRKTYRSKAVVVKSDEEKDEPAEEEEKEPELVEKSPFGGATSFDDVEKFLKDEEEVFEVMDHFMVLDSILFNIQMSDEIDDRPNAMSQAVSDFKSRVDSAVKRSLTVRAATMFLESENEEGEPMTEKEKEIVEEEPKVEEAPATPLDEKLEKFKSAVMEAAEGDGPVEDRLKAIQPSLNELAETVKVTVEGEEVANATVIASAVAEAVGNQLAPLTEAITLLAAKSEVKGPAPDKPMIPGPRGYIPPAVDVETGEKEKSPLRTMIRKSVGLKE
jgi:hypothetical protein